MNSILRDRHAAYFPWPERTFICLAILLAYASVWPNEFLFDDIHLIRNNEFLKHWSSLPQLLTSLNFKGSGLPGLFYRPVPMVLHFFLYQAFGLSTIAFHALNIVLHALNACLLLQLGLRTGFGKGAAFAAAILWAVHPLHTEAVSYMSSTPELLWSTFALLGLLTLVPGFTLRRTGLALVFFALALGCKESAVVFPALAAVTLFLVSKDRTRFSLYLRTWPFWALAAAYVIAWLVFMSKTNYAMWTAGTPMLFEEYAASLASRILTCLATLPVYAGLILWPEGLHLARNFPVYFTLRDWLPAAGALMAALGLLQILWGRARRGLALSFGLLWFAAAQSPNTGIVLPIDALISEHWMYLPTMGLFLGVAQTAAKVFEKKEKAARLLVLVLVFSLGAATFIQNGKWRDAGAMYENIARNGGHLRQFSSHMGNFYLAHQEFDKAIEQFQYLVDHPDGHPGYMWAQVHMNIALARLEVDLDENASTTPDEILPFLASSAHISEAIAEFYKAIAADPNNYWAHKFLVAIYRYQGNAAMAELHEKQAGDILRKQTP
jgi:protein O-mannosyl-transferase